MNTLLKINRLPPEVLAMIPYFLNSYKDLVNVTHVCRHWRRTFIASPPLWSCLDSGMVQEDLITAFMDRCGATPLDVTFSSRLGYKIGPFLEKVAPRWARIRKIDFSHIPWDHITRISNDFDVPLPMLREVHVCVADSNWSSLHMPPFLAGATNLVSLRVSFGHCYLRTFKFLAIPTLTHLELKFRDLCIDPFLELLNFFRNLPLLERIHIRATKMYDGSSGSPDKFQPVDLPYLRDVHLNCAMLQDQLALLTKINRPPTCSVTMKARSLSSIEDPQNVFLRSWEGFSLPYISSVTFRTKHCVCSTKHTTIVKGPDGVSISISNSQEFEAYDSVSDDKFIGQIFLAAIPLVRELPLHQIREVVLEDLYTGQWWEQKSLVLPPDLVKLLRSDLPNLATLSLTGICAPELLKILVPPKEGGTPEPNLPCPSLKVLEIRNPDWLPTQDCREVFGLVKARKLANVPFERVYFHSLFVQLSMVKGMAWHVNESVQLCRYNRTAVYKVVENGTEKRIEGTVVPRPGWRWCKQ